MNGCSDDDLCYETDIEDLPDNKLSQGVVNDLSELNDIIEDNVGISSYEQKNKDTSIYCYDISSFKGYLRDFIIIFITVFVFTNKTVIGNVMNTSIFLPYKKTFVFNIIIGFI